jgi:LysM repeat protein
MNEEMKTPAANGKLSTIFLVVLGLHVAVIVAFIAYNLLKGNTEAVPELADAAPAEEVAPATEPATLSSPAPSLETEVNPVAEAGSPPDAAMNGQMTMPSPTDPIYSTAGTIQPRPMEPITPVEPVAVSTSSAPVIETVKPVTSAVGNYTAKKGDSLAKIARTHNISIQALREANSLQGDMIKIGQTFSIPGSTVKAAAVPAATVVKAQVPVKSGSSEYTVAAGDTLWKIAKSFNTQPSQIAKLNGITDPSKLKVGSTIKVPTSSSQEASVPKAQPVRTNVQNTDVAMVPQAKRQ